MKVYTRDSASGSWVERDLLRYSVSDTLNERSTASIELLDPTGALTLKPGYGIKLTDSDGDVFLGFIDTASESRLGLDGARTHNLECHDQTYLLDKRVIVGAWTTTNAGAIVNAILTKLAGEGLTAGSIAPGATITAYTANYEPAAAVIQDLAERSGYWWRVNLDGTVDFQDPTGSVEAITWDDEEITWDGDAITFGISSGSASTTVGADDALADTVDASSKAPLYRNRVWIRGGKATTVSQSESAKGDGSKTSFPVGFPLAKEPTIEVDTGGGFVAQTVGVAGLTTGKDWYWTYGSNVITQDSDGTPLDATDTLKVTYLGLYDVVVRVDDAGGQSDLADVEGGTGIVERVTDDKSITTRAAAVELAEALLKAYADDSDTVRFATLRTDYRPGDRATVTIAGATRTMLITTVETTDRGGQPYCVVTLASGPLTGSWAQFFNAPLKATRALTQTGDIQIVMSALTFEKTWTEAERPNIYYEKFPSASLQPGSTIVPAFEHDHRVRYLAWHESGAETGRKAITNTTDQGTSPIDTETVLGVTDAVGDLSHFSWWGGEQATASTGTGVMLEKVDINLTKTNLETITVNRTDRKGW